MILIDQVKAFERLSWQWVQKVLEGWRLPGWLLNGLTHLTTQRSVCVLVNGVPGVARALRRGLGMGAPHSPLKWNMSYDPITSAVCAALGIPTPTYVDDTAALASDPEQALLAFLMLMAASSCAGLSIAVHTCVCTVVQLPAEVVRRTLACLPCLIEAHEGARRAEVSRTPSSSPSSERRM